MPRVCRTPGGARRRANFCQARRAAGIFGLGVVGRRIRLAYDVGSGILVGFFSSPVRPSLGRTLRLVSANVGTYNAIHPQYMHRSGHR